ncbi:MAG: aminotransferase class I/II-fold pyridoxal phosphate-dependent enzyme [Geminicoccaceae bacterium]|nr:aminotransferase class I/II-fold pyridoxal phosphate-dependent enzyme [Geminicoccaceae bacterium]MDW8341984.1 aminotransferase class I/II-fold pyridoxal phosphate-dependent enzyme [Geminicoccaceae bacterium]
MTAARRPWVPDRLEDRISARIRHFARLDADALESELEALLCAHEAWHDRACLNLYAGTNLLNPRAAAFLSRSVASRPSLGWPGDKYETGLAMAEQIEIMAQALICAIFRCRFCEFRVASGSLANLYAFMATCRPGDRIMAFPEKAAGHVTHHAAGAAGLYGLEVHEVPFDDAAFTVDLDRLRAEARRVRPKLIVLAGSLNLVPHPVGEVRAIADEIGAYVMYDAAHVSGLLAGGCFQDPLGEGAHLVTMSTYKSLGGPPGGLVLTDDPALAEKLDRIAYPGLTANFDLARIAALVVALLDIAAFGAAYARAMIANARALGEALAAEGVPVVAPAEAFPTRSHHLAIDARPFGGGTRACRAIEPANILASGINLPLPPVSGDFNGIRLGTQEITRLGMEPETMRTVARLFADALLARRPLASVRAEVVALRESFQRLHFVR